MKAVSASRDNEEVSTTPSRPAAQRDERGKPLFVLDFHLSEPNQLGTWTEAISIPPKKRGNQLRR
jgi:hypothetical protein